MVSDDTVRQSVSVTTIFLHLVGKIGDESDESGNTSVLFIDLASLVSSTPTPLYILHNGVDMGSLDSLVPVGGSSKLFHFFKCFLGELEGRKQSSVHC